MNPAAAAATGRELLGSGDSLAVERFRARLMGRLGVPRAPRGGRVLDIGCGDGLEAQWFARAGWKVEAYDIAPHPRWHEIERAWKGKIRFKLGDAKTLGRLRGGFDRVFQKDVLHHVPQPLELLQTMRRLVKPGGVLDVVECNRANPIFYLHLTLWGGHQHFSRNQLRRLLEQAGLQGYRLSLLEARVWPWQHAGFQDLMDKIQDLIERAPGLGPLLCYHLVRWTRPKKG